QFRADKGDRKRYRTQTHTKCRPKPRPSSRHTRVKRMLLWICYVTHRSVKANGRNATVSPRQSCVPSLAKRTRCLSRTASLHFRWQYESHLTFVVTGVLEGRPCGHRRRVLLRRNRTQLADAIPRC